MSASENTCGYKYVHESVHEYFPACVRKCKCIYPHVQATLNGDGSMHVPTCRGVCRCIFLCVCMEETKQKSLRSFVYLHVPELVLLVCENMGKLTGKHGDENMGKLRMQACTSIPKVESVCIGGHVLCEWISEHILGSVCEAMSECAQHSASLCTMRACV